MMKSDNPSRGQRSLIRGNLNRGPERGRKMRPTLYAGHCRGCPGKREGICIFTGLPVRDRDPCSAPVPPKRRKRKRPKIDHRTVTDRCKVAELAKLRREAGIKGIVLARRIGISYSYFRDLESGMRRGSVRTFVRWLLALDRERGLL